MKRHILFLAGASFFLASLSLVCGEAVVDFFRFDGEAELWQRTAMERGENAVSDIGIKCGIPFEGSRSLKVAMNFPGEGCIETFFFKDLSRYSDIIFDLYEQDDGVEDNMRVLFFLVDNEWLWYETELFELNPGDVRSFSLNVRPESPFWKPVGHGQAWSEKPASAIRKTGVKFFSGTRGERAVYIERVAGKLDLLPSLRVNKDVLRRHELFEISFHLPNRYLNPFDNRDIKAEGVFISPSGTETVVPAFYYQDYVRGLQDGVEVLSPAGLPFWKVRFRGEGEGEYQYFVRAVIEGSELVSSKGSFAVSSQAKGPGPVGLSCEGNRYFAFGDNTAFYPVGLNVRSPTDVRYAQLAGRPLDKDEGTYYYETIFEMMSNAGMNFAEVWLAPWFSALEWQENRPGYRGIGYYNLRNAWKIDRVLDSAAKYGIYVQLVLINHGQLSTWCDQEWQDHPYNIANGGFLERPDEFFTDLRAKELFKRQLNYIIGRWSYSPNLFSWELINEMNLIGAQRGFYKQEEESVNNWYREMRDYVKDTDPFSRMVTAHYTVLVNNEITSDIVDYNITNAYYDVEKGQFLTGMLDNIYRFKSRLEKPVFVSEYGGTPHAGTVDNLKRDIIAGLWYSYHMPFAGGPLFWWHRLIKDRELFYLYRNFTEYISGIDKIALGLEQKEVKIEHHGEGEKLKLAAKGGLHLTICWIYDVSVMGDLSEKQPESFEGVSLSVPVSGPGLYGVSFYGMEEGFLREEDVSAVNGSVSVQLPRFERWIAVKVDKKSNND